MIDHIKNFGKRIIESKFGKTKWQKTFTKLHLLTLKGMNIGQGSSINLDGELFALKYVKNKLIDSRKISSDYKLIIFDVGANIGDYTRAIQKEFESVQVEIFAFEPSKQTFAKLKERIGDKKNIHLENL